MFLKSNVWILQNLLLTTPWALQKEPLSQNHKRCQPENCLLKYENCIGAFDSMGGFFCNHSICSWWCRLPGQPKSLPSPWSMLRGQTVYQEGILKNTALIHQSRIIHFNSPTSSWQKGQFSRLELSSELSRNPPPEQKKNGKLYFWYQKFILCL